MKDVITRVWGTTLALFALLNALFVIPALAWVMFGVLMVDCVLAWVGPVIIRWANNRTTYR